MCCKLKDVIEDIIGHMPLHLSFIYRCAGDGVGGAEMVEFMKRVAALDVELSVEERNLISVAYKNVIGARRASWRIISSLESKEESKGDARLEMTKQYRGKVSGRGRALRGLGWQEASRTGAR